MDKVLEVKNLSKVYGQGCAACFDLTGPEHATNLCPKCGSVVAAHNVSFDLYKGEMLGILGESGSGKSTAVMCLNFDQIPNSGINQFYYGDAQYDLFNRSAAISR